MSLDKIFEFVQEFSIREKVAPSVSRILEFSLEELFINTVKHNSAGDGKIIITLLRDNDTVEMKLVDPDSKPFDPAQAPPPDIHLPLEQREPGGLGIHLVKQLVDEVAYSYQGRTSTIRIFKKLGDENV